MQAGSREKSPRFRLAVLAAGALTASVMGAFPASASGPEGVPRPTLEKIKATAKAKGVSLEKALAAHLAAARTKLGRADEPDGPVSTPEVMVDDLPAAELEDLKEIAKTERMGFAEAIDRYGWQSRYIDVTETLDARFGAEASGATTAGDGGSAWFGFKGKAPARAVKLIKSLPVKVEIEENRGFSEGELAKATETAHDQVDGEAETKAVTTTYDIRSGKVEVAAELKPSIQRGARILREITPKSPGGGISVDVKIVDDASSNLEDGYIRGGATQYKKVSGSWRKNCTAGFNLISKTGRYKRTSSAGHCGGRGAKRLNKNHGTQGGSTVVTVIKSHQGSYGDLGYATTGSKKPTRTFYHDSQKPRYATSRSGRPSVGTWICHWGYKTKKSCGKVQKRIVHGSTAKNLVGMDRNMSAGGDSGGPWYWGGKAYGVHYGKPASTGKSAFTLMFKFKSWTGTYNTWIK